MKLFIFENTIGNLCSGDYYFLAEDINQAIKLADEFANTHNKTINNHPNYIIEWDREATKELELNTGFFPINRLNVYMEK